MDDPILTIEEREAINSGRWFSSLSPSLRHDILRCAYVKRYKDGQLISARGDVPEEWISCARGAVRVSSTSITGKQVTLTYVEPGLWIGDVAIFDGERRTHDSYAHGNTTLLCVSRVDLRKILSLHVELYEALLRLHARRIRQLFGLVEDLNTLPLRARLAKQLLHLVRSYGQYQACFFIIKINFTALNFHINQFTIFFKVPVNTFQIFRIFNAGNYLFHFCHFFRRFYIVHRH